MIKLSDDLLHTVTTLAKEAGEAILQVYNSDFDVTKKSDASPLTLADLNANKVIIEGLSLLTPDIPVLSEETTLADFKTRRLWSYYWLIDPLDGTREFIKRNGEFTVNIALIHVDTPILGVVYAPVSDALFYAIKGHGAFKEAIFQNGKYQKLSSTIENTAKNIGVCEKPLSLLPQRISTKLVDLSRPVIAGSRSHVDEHMQRFIERLTNHLNVKPELISMGSSLKICMIAEGIADVYPRLGLTSEWDTAAAHCILKEAGGEIVDTTGQVLRYNTKDNILNPPFYAIGQYQTANAYPWWQHSS
jgi:3'(2'), 5'-bisphosphate nucleotidase